MKKIITSALLTVLTVSALNAVEKNYYVGDYNWTSKAQFKTDILDKNYNGATGGTITFNLASETTAVEFTSDFTFESTVSLTGATIRFDANVGTTITFNTITSSGTRLAINNKGTTVFKAGDFSAMNDIYLQSTELATTILDGANFKNGHTHFYNGVKVLAKQNAEISLIYFRASNKTNSFGRLNGGTVAAEGCTLTINNFARNPVNGFSNGDFYFEFASEGADTIVVNNAAMYNIIIGDATSQIILKDFGLMDSFQTKEQLSLEKFADKIFVESNSSRESLASLLASGKIIEDTTTNQGFFTYTAIPEPSTYAAIFGALALGFVAYRRKTR